MTTKRTSITNGYVRTGQSQGCASMRSPLVQPLEPRKLLSGFTGEIDFDITGGAVVLADTLHHGDKLKLRLTDRNDGDFGADEVSYYLDVNADGAVDGGDLLLGVGDDGDAEIEWEGRVSQAWGTGTLQFLAVVDDLDPSAQRVLTATADVADALPSSTLIIYDVDGDIATLKLTGTSDGVITYNYDGSGYITEILVSGTDLSRATLKVKVKSEDGGGDGKLLVGAFGADTDAGMSVADMNFKVLDFRAVEFDGAGVEINSARKASFGDFSGSASLTGTISQLFLGDVNTTGTFTIDGVTKLRAGLLSVGGGIIASSVGLFDIRGDAIFDLELGEDGDHDLVRKIHVRGDASGDWVFRGTQRVNLFRVDGAASLNLDDSTYNANFSVKKFKIGGADDSALDLQITGLEKLDINGDVLFSDASYLTGVKKLHIKGSVLGGNLTMDEPGGKLEIDGDVNAGASITIIDGSFELDGDLYGSLDMTQAHKVEIDGHIYSTTINFIDSADAKLEVGGSLVSSTLQIDEAGIDEMEFDGTVNLFSTILSLGHIDEFKADTLHGSVTALSFDEIKIETEINVGEIIATATSGIGIGELKVEGDVLNATIRSVADIEKITVEGNVSETSIYLGLDTDWSSGIPASADDFTNADATLGRLQIEGESSGLTIAAPTIDDLRFGTLMDTATTRVGAIEVGEAHFKAEGDSYHFDFNELFTDSPALAYLELTQL